MGKRYIFLACIVGVFAFLVLTDPVQAAEEAAKGGYLSGYENTDPRPSPVSWWSTIAYLVSLFAVFAFVVGLAYFAARFLGGILLSRSLAMAGEFCPICHWDPIALFVW